MATDAELEAGLEHLRVFHGSDTPTSVCDRLRAIMSELAAKRKREGTQDVDEDDREDISKRPRMSAKRLFYRTLRTANNDDFWTAYFATTGDQREIAETKIIPRRDEIVVNNYLQVEALERSLDRYDADKRGLFRVLYFDMVPVYTEVRAIRENALESGDYEISRAFVRCLLKLLAVSNLQSLELKWVHLGPRVFELLMDHGRLRTLVLDDGVSASPSVDVGAWLEKLPIVRLQAPVRFAPTALLSRQLSNPAFLKQVAESPPWMLHRSGEPRKFESIRELSIAELDVHHAEELTATNSYAWPVDQLLVHDNINLVFARIFPRLEFCVFDVARIRTSTVAQTLTPEELEVFPRSCKQVSLSLRAAATIIDDDRKTAMVGSGRRVSSVNLLVMPHGNPAEIDGEGFVSSFPRVKNLTLSSFDLLSSSLRNASRYYWRTIHEVPDWIIASQTLAKSEAQTVFCSVADYRIQKLAHRKRMTIDPAITKSSRTTKLAIWSIKEEERGLSNRIVSTPVSLPPNLTTFVSVNDLWFAEKALQSMSDETRSSLRDVWLHQMSVSEIDESLGVVKWTITPNEFPDGLAAATLDRLHPDALVNGRRLSSIPRREE